MRERIETLRDAIYERIVQSVDRANERKKWKKQPQKEAEIKRVIIWKLIECTKRGEGRGGCQRLVSNRQTIQSKFSVNDEDVGRQQQQTDGIDAMNRE